MLGIPMPFSPVPCSIWLAHDGGPDGYGNPQVDYSDSPDIEATCCYAPGSYTTNTANDIEDGRPHGVRVSMTFYLPKTLDADLRGALIACHPSDDATLSALRFRVVGEPFSYPRANTPGDYSWALEAVTYLG